ncbi:MAG: hypothetical protein AB7K24_06250 [Gemmataceae bacterium]
MIRRLCTGLLLVGLVMSTGCCCRKHHGGCCQPCCTPCCSPCYSSPLSAAPVGYEPISYRK